MIGMKDNETSGKSFSTEIFCTNPFSGYICTPAWGISSIGRALAWHARGNRFDPGILHSFKAPRGAFIIMSFFVYILYSSTRDKYYVGSCSDPHIRLQQHNSGRNTSTKYGMPWIRIYQETFETQPEARRRELENKKSRKYIEWLISHED